MKKSNKWNIIITMTIIILVAIIFFVCWFKLGRNEAQLTDVTVLITESTTEKATETEPPKETMSVLEESSVSSTKESTSKTETSTQKQTTKQNTTTEKEGSTYAYAYAGFNPVLADTSAQWNMLLVNRDYILPENFSVKLSSLSEIGSSERLDSRVVPHYIKMYNAAKADGIILTPVSGYRTYERQKINFENKISVYINQGYNEAKATDLAAQIILPPGTSEHNAGLAMDIISLETSFENTSAFKWLVKNAEDYGFILRYPKDKTDITKITYEPWHWRYVGVETAKAINKSGKTLEEYLGVK